MYVRLKIYQDQKYARLSLARPDYQNFDRRPRLGVPDRALAGVLSRSRGGDNQTPSRFYVVKQF